MPTPQVTDAEFSVLEALWNTKFQTIRELTLALYPSGTVSDYATVQKLLERLEAKQFVRRDRSAHAHVFYSIRERDDLISSQLQRLADKLCDGSLAPVLMHLVQATSLTKSDREMLRQMLDTPKSKKAIARRKA